MGIQRYKQLLYHDSFKQQCIQLMTCDTNRWTQEQRSIQDLDYGIRLHINQCIQNIDHRNAGLRKQVKVNVAVITIDGQTQVDSLDVVSVLS